MSDFEDRLRGELHELAAGAEPPPTLSQRIDNRTSGGPGQPGGSGWRGGPEWLPKALVAVAAAIVLTAVTVGVVAARGPRGLHLVATGGTTTTVASSGPLGVTPGLPGAPPTSDTTLLIPPPTTVAPATTVSPTTTTGKATTTAAPTTTVAIPDCTPSQLEATAATDAPAYMTGTAVTITVRVSNVSATRCQVQNPLANPFTDAVKISGSSGVVWQPRSIINGLIAQHPPQVLAPQQSYQWATVVWNQHQCVDPCTLQGLDQGQVPIGSYSVVPLNTPGPATPHSFTIF